MRCYIESVTNQVVEETDDIVELRTRIKKIEDELKKLGVLDPVS